MYSYNKYTIATAFKHENVELYHNHNHRPKTYITLTAYHPRKTFEIPILGQPI